MPSTFPPDNFIPAQLNAGDTWQFTLSLLNYPANQGWTAKWYLAGYNNGTYQNFGPYTATTDPNGTDFDFLISAATTAALNTTGTPLVMDYRVIMFGSGAYVGQVFTAVPSTAFSGQTRFTIQPNLQASPTFNPLSPYEQELALVQTTIQALITGQTQSATIGGQTFTVFDLEKLKNHRVWLLEKIKEETVQNNILAGRKSGRQVQARFIEAFPQAAQNPYWWTPY